MEHTNSTIIEGVILKKLDQYWDDRGAVLHYLNSEHQYFTNFGEAYFSIVNKGIIKGWKCHDNLNQFLVSPKGSIDFVLYDNRENSKTKGLINKICIGSKKDNYYLLRLPKGIWYSFKGNDEFNLLANIIDKQHSEAISKTIPIDDEMIPFKW